jgi:hypothetical protein
MPRALCQGCKSPQSIGNIDLAGGWRRQTYLHTSHGPRGRHRGGPSPPYSSYPAFSLSNPASSDKSMVSSAHHGNPPVDVPESAGLSSNSERENPRRIAPRFTD